MQPKLMWTHVQSFVCGGHGRGAGKGGREGRESEEGREDEGREGEEVGGGQGGVYTVKEGTNNKYLGHI